MQLRRHLVNMKIALSSNILNYLSTYRKWQTLSQEELRLAQEEQLKSALKTAYEDVPFYQKCLKEHEVITSRGEVNLSNFSRLPLLDKTTIHNNYNDLSSQKLEHYDWYKGTTGGSTGDPALFLFTKPFFERCMAVKMLFDEWSDYYPGDKKALLWGSERDLYVGEETFRVKLARWTRNERWFNAYKMTPEQMRDYLEQLDAFQPKQFLAYTEALYSLACFAKRENIKIKPPKAIMSSAGTLYKHMRDVIQEAFDAPIYNRYGTREVGDIACECSHHKGMHIFSFHHYLEILRPDGTAAAPGEVGEIVITPLINPAMPLIRYRIGDMGCWAQEPCSCGMKLPLLKEVTGRLTDVFYKQDGGIIVPEYLVMLAGEVLHSSAIKRYQVIQEDYDHVTVLISCHANSPYPEKELAEVKERIKFVMGKDCKVDIKRLEHIPFTPSGKYRYTISKVQAPQQRLELN